MRFLISVEDRYPQKHPVVKVAAAGRCRMTMVISTASTHLSDADSRSDAICDCLAQPVIEPAGEELDRAG
jgi:hypothetical protein